MLAQRDKAESFIFGQVIYIWYFFSSDLEWDYLCSYET